MQHLFTESMGPLREDQAIYLDTSGWRVFRHAFALFLSHHHGTLAHH